MRSPPGCDLAGARAAAESSGIRVRVRRESNHGERPQSVRPDGGCGCGRRRGCSCDRRGPLPAAGAGLVSAPAASQSAGRVEGIEAFAFDAYGTLFDVFSVTALCEELFPGERRCAGAALARQAAPVQPAAQSHGPAPGLLAGDRGCAGLRRSQPRAGSDGRAAGAADGRLISRWPPSRTCGRGCRRSGTGESGWRSSRTASRACWRRRRRAPASTPSSTRSSASRR